MFIAIISEEVNKQWRRSDVFLVNTSDKAFMVKQTQGAFDGSGDELINLGHGEVGTFELQPKNFHKIDHIEDGGELDFTTWYKFNIEDKETHENTESSGHINSWIILSDKKKEQIPIINKEGIRLNWD